MSQPIIQVEGLGKRYRIHHQRPERYSTLRDTIARRFKSLVTMKSVGKNPRSADEDFWALKDVSFEINEGEVIGIIGRNGAGKSTLLKVLSRITEPTKGKVTLRGRVASLLEVGTGFHPELTGRENVYLNGAILGMSRTEIRRKFDEIVAFAEVERFLDTPVKHYSSGMYVRLAFAVAAHLEPEILIVDEVLAVGDALFQKKCLGKIREVASGDGRTVLFVSHNMSAVTSLTSRSIVLSAGQQIFSGPTTEAVEYYSKLGQQDTAPKAPLGKGAHATLLSARLLDKTGRSTRDYIPGEPFKVEFSFVTDGSANLSMEAFLLDASRLKIALFSLYQFHNLTLPDRAGQYRLIVEMEQLWLASGFYSFDLTTSIVNSNWDHYVESMLEFEVHSSNPGNSAWDFKQSMGFGSLALMQPTLPKFESL